MITFVKKTEPQPVLKETEDNRFERIRKAALKQRQNTDTDEARRRALPEG